MWAWLYWCGVDDFRWRNTQPKVNRLFNSARTCSFRCGCALTVRVSVCLCVYECVNDTILKGWGGFRMFVRCFSNHSISLEFDVQLFSLFNYIRALSLLSLISANGINVKLSIWLEEIEIEINLIGMKCCAVLCCAVLSACECASVCVSAYV